MKSFCLSLVLSLALVSSYGQGPTSDVNQFIDAWHMAASNADAKKFFGSMAEDAIYIGTDATERWTKSEFVTFAKPYFDRGKAWDFKPRDRDIHVTSDGQNVWFSELLDTWMGVCRGSGILIKTGEGWKLEQYHLSVTVPNAIIKDFITLVDNFAKKEKP
ncbi:MAG TPA: nuclear transport factor 2 family protein [Chryseolinea sp.]|nr:nuclear transport factor 2 family protein [Chryseolinea sp.]